MALAPTPDNFRAEIARFHLLKEDICREIGMSPAVFSRFLHGRRPLQSWAAHNIGIGINRVAGRRLIDVDEARGLLSAPPPGRVAGWNRPTQISSPQPSGQRAG